MARRVVPVAVLVGITLFLGGCAAAGKKDALAPSDASAGSKEEAETSSEGPTKQKSKSKVAEEEPSAASDDDEVSAGDAASAAGTKKDKPVEPSAPKAAPRPEMAKKARRPYKDGNKAFSAGDLQGAKAQYEAALAADARAYEAAYALGVAYERLGNASKAAASYAKSLQSVPDFEPALVASAILKARQGSPDDALKALKKQGNTSGKSAALLAAMAEVSSMKGESGDAQDLAQQALKVDPAFTPAMVVLARDHYRARRIDLALYALTGILDGYGADNPPRDKNNAEARLIRGLIYADRELRGPAMEEMEKALALRPDLVDAHLVLANYMMEAGNAKDARPHLEMAIRYDNKNVAAHLQLGDAYRLLNRPDDARRELEWVLAADPAQTSAHYNLGLLFLLSGKIKGLAEGPTIDKALEHLEAYKAKAPRGGPDDVDELITRAKTKKALLNAKQEQEAAGNQG